MATETGNPVVTIGNVELPAAQSHHDVPLSITGTVTKAADVQPQLLSGVLWCALLIAKGNVCVFISRDVAIHPVFSLLNIIPGRVPSFHPY